MIVKAGAIDDSTHRIPPNEGCPNELPCAATPLGTQQPSADDGMHCGPSAHHHALHDVGFMHNEDKQNKTSSTVSVKEASAPHGGGGRTNGTLTDPPTAAAQEEGPKRKAGVWERLRSVVSAANAMKNVRQQREARLLAQIPFDSSGHVSTELASRVLLGCGLTLTSNLRTAVSQPSTSFTPGAKRQQLHRSDIEALLTEKAEEIAAMEHLDGLADADADDKQGKTVATSRLLISSRIASLVRKTMSLGNRMHQRFDLLHYVSILVHFTVVIFYGAMLLDKEPKAAHAVMWAVSGLWVVDIGISLAHGIEARFFLNNGNRDAVTIPASGVSRCSRYCIPFAVDVVTALPVDMVLYHFCEDEKPVGRLPFNGYPIYSAFLIFRWFKLIKPVRILWMFQFSSLDLITPSFITFFFLVRPTLLILASVVVVVQLLVVASVHVQGHLEDQLRLASDAPLTVFLDALVRVISMLTGSGPDTTFDGAHGTVLALLLMVCGLIAQAAVISNLSVTVFRNDVAAMNVQQMRETLSILEHFRVPKDVSTEILSFQLHTISDDVSFRLSTLDTLPAKMQKEVLLYVKVAAVNTVKLFTKASHECKMKIAELLVQTVVPPTTDIVAIGDVGEEMFLIAHGYASVIIFNGMTVAMLSRGDYFGEVALLLPNNIRQATVRALTYCDLWVLDKPSFHDIVANFPALMAAMGSSHVVKVDRRDVKEPARSTTPALISVMNTNSNNQSYRSSRKSSGPPEHPMPSKKRQGELGAVVVDKPAVRPSSRPRSPSGAVVSKRRLNSMFVDRNHRSISLIGEDPHVAAMAPFLGEELFVGRQSPRASGAAIEDSQLSRSNRWLPIVNDTVGSSGRYSSYAATSATPLEQHIRSAPTVSSGSPTDGGGGAANTPLRAASASPTAHCGNSAEVPTADEVQRLRDALFKAIELVRALSSETAP